MTDTASRRRERFDGHVTVPRQHQAREHVLVHPLDVALVERGTVRAAVFQCPCGCGNVLVINLDPAAGPAWRHRVDGEQLTLMPSVWRDSGCDSHFVLWRNEIYWCGVTEEDTDARSWPSTLRAELKGWWQAWRRRRRGSA